MSPSRTISPSFICNACRSAVTRPRSLAFGLYPFRSRAAPQPANVPLKALQCAFSTNVARRRDRNDPIAEDPEFVFLSDATNPELPTNVQQPEPDSIEVATESAQPAKTTEEAIESAQYENTLQSQADASIPWYLRESPRYMTNAAPGHQPSDLPELPANPPPLLETLLQYISVTAGLDDLHLLDLRHLDPPPALGPKLIMIIGTARSEKHLHVAADRFCRFLRREHGLKANAAGLLGRNELKIKLRRKAKRMRMLANVGGTVPEGNLDDGIRTGWICCTLGKIEAHPQDQHMPGDNVQDFVGFRDFKPGVNVVVQMFTEEKRIETDLETLWGGVVKTHHRRDKSADEALQELEQDIEDLEDDLEDDQRPHTVEVTESPAVEPSDSAQPSTPAQPFRRPRASPGDFFPSASNSDMGRQLRRLHTVGLR